MENNKTAVLLQLWADDTLLNIRRRELLNDNGQEDIIIRNDVDTELARVRDNTAACLQRGEMTVTDFVTMLNDMTRYNRIATRWLLHQFASARINPILFSSQTPNNPHVLEDWIDDLRELLDCFQRLLRYNSRETWTTRTLLLLEDQFPPSLVQARLHELEHTLETKRQKRIAIMMATDKRWGKDSPLHSLDPDLLKRYLL